ncbi:hypothetical protein FRZ61_01430 [Hypericibacter adhaerens]|uniref:Uncharacterized protein n=1 Tax=Hypericibacter adhaerens TaxID=2602016 RepID=A0A5J6MSX7_9PROT|nr:hypothetical protein [Hypericibacter adhaerens]QEX20227.1 hypothetical protein FRZ61_01430 [Hypericibacter adhaerens]
MTKTTARKIEQVRRLDREIADAKTRVVVAWAEVEQKQQQGALRQGRKDNMMKSAAERARVHKYCQKAPLLERGQIIDFDDAMLMGAILTMAEMLADRQTRYQCWVAGHAEFLKAGKTRRKPAWMTVRFDTKPRQAVLDIMNAAKFSYDAASMTWCGEGDVGHARDLIDKSGVGGAAEAAPRMAKSRKPTV